MMSARKLCRRNSPQFIPLTIPQMCTKKEFGALYLPERVSKWVPSDRAVQPRRQWGISLLPAAI